VVEGIPIEPAAEVTANIIGLNLPAS